MKILQIIGNKVYATRTILAVLLFAMITSLTGGVSQAAVNANFSLSPASKTVTVGDDLVVYLMLDTGGNSVLAWKTTITYSTSIFSSASVATDSSSHFTLNPTTDVASGGTIKIARYATSSSTTNGAMAKITLHTKATGSATLSFAHICSTTYDSTPCSAVTGSAGTNLLSTITNGSYSVATAGSSGSTTTTTKKKSLLSKVADAVANVVSPSTSAEDPTASNSTTISDGTARITVKDKKGKPIVGAKVTLAGVSAITDKNGQVVLTGLYPGDAKGTITYKNKTQTINLLVESGTSLDAPQEANFTFTAAGSNKILPILAAILGVAVIIGLIDLMFVSKGGFKANVDKVIHHSGGDGSTTAAKHSASRLHAKHEPMAPGQVIEPSQRDIHHNWRD